MPESAQPPNVDQIVETLSWSFGLSHRPHKTLAWTELLDVCAAVFYESNFHGSAERQVCAQLWLGPGDALFISLLVGDSDEGHVEGEAEEGVAACPARRPDVDGETRAQIWTHHYKISTGDVHNLVLMTDPGSYGVWTVVDATPGCPRESWKWVWAYTFRGGEESGNVGDVTGRRNVGAVPRRREHAFLRWLAMMFAQVSSFGSLKLLHLDVSLLLQVGSLFASGKAVGVTTGSALQAKSRIPLGRVDFATVKRAALSHEGRDAGRYTCILSTLPGYDAEGRDAVVLAFVSAPPKESGEAHGDLSAGVLPAFSFLAFRTGDPNGGFSRHVRLAAPGLPPGALAHPVHAWETTFHEIWTSLHQWVFVAQADGANTSISPPGVAWGFYDAREGNARADDALADLQDTMFNGGQRLPSTSAQLRSAAARGWWNASPTKRAGLIALAAGGIGASALAYRQLAAPSGTRSQPAAKRGADGRPTAARKPSSTA